MHALCLIMTIFKTSDIYEILLVAEDRQQNKVQIETRDKSQKEKSKLEKTIPKG